MSADFVTVERVARSADELALLARIAWQPADDLARLVYADWLEERGEPPTSHLLRSLRSFVEACKGSDTRYSLEGVPQAWADLTGLTVGTKMLECGLGDYRDQLLALARPALLLEAPEIRFPPLNLDRTDEDDPSPPTPRPLGTTRLGGDPDLPEGTAYPADADGVPLHFISQFNLADLQGTVAGLAFPDDGLLSIFRLQTDRGIMGDADDWPRLVRFTPPGTPLARLPRPTDVSDTPAPFRPGFRLVETLRLPGQFQDWPGVTLTDQQVDQFDDVFPTNLGGTAYLLLGHVTHGNTGEEPLKHRPDWIQLVLVPYSKARITGCMTRACPTTSPPPT